MLEATRKALAKAQTSAKADVTAVAGTLAGEKQQRVAAEAEADAARVEARLAAEALAAERLSTNSRLETLQQRAEGAEAQLNAARVRNRSLAADLFYLYADILRQPYPVRPGKYVVHD